MLCYVVNQKQSVYPKLLFIDRINDIKINFVVRV